MISVIVVNFNGQRFLDSCISSLLAQSYTDFEIILVDNGSADGSVDFVRSAYPSVRIIENTENRGFAGGVNDGIRDSGSDYILTLNNDIIADRGFLEELVKPMDANPLVGMCAAKMLFPDGRINSTGICISRSGAAWDRGIFEEDKGQYGNEEEVFGPCGGAALFRKKMLDEIGLFDEDFFLFMEDVDLAFRARLAGWKCMYVPEAKVIHFHGGTAGFRSDLSIYYGNRNNVWHVIKNFPLKKLFFYSPWIIGRNCAIIPYYIAKGNGRAIILAKIDALLGIRIMLRKRKGILRSDSEPEIEGWVQPWARIGK